jgi:hypothetical protein
MDLASDWSYSTSTLILILSLESLAKTDASPPLINNVAIATNNNARILRTVLIISPFACPVDSCINSVLYFNKSDLSAG